MNINKSLEVLQTKLYMAARLAHVAKALESSLQN